MQWLNKAVDELITAKPEGEILIESGVSPSGTYHIGTLREVLTCDAILAELKRRGRKARHIHYCDDLDVFRKVPVNVPADFYKYLGRPVCDVPAPDGSGQSYADFFLNDFLDAAKILKMDMQVVRSHKEYRAGKMEPAIEKALSSVGEIRQIIEKVSGRKLEDDWAPIQVLEGEYLKNRRFVKLDEVKKTVTYHDADGKESTASYLAGDVKLNWRVDWPARWWLLGVDIEPFGRDHATKGGSYDTGAAIIKKVYGANPPQPVPYNFINSIGETKKMSKSAGNIIAISEMVQVLPPEVVRFFVLGAPPDKLLFFDPKNVTKLIDDFAALLAKPKKDEADKQLLAICSGGTEPVVSAVPFSHLVASYQAALNDPAKTLEVISRTEHAKAAKEQAETIKKELKFIDSWLKNWAPDDAKFELAAKPPPGLNDAQIAFLASLADKIETASAGADGEWFHKAIYELREATPLEPKDMFAALYKALIGKTAGPRAGWFLSILPREWLVKRLRLEA